MAASRAKCDLKQCYFCRQSLKEWIPAVEAHRKNFHFKKGELLFREGDPVDGIYFVYSGLVKVHKKWEGEKEIILRFADSGSILGHRGLGGDTIYPISGTALEPTMVCFFELDFFMTSLKVNPQFTYSLMMFYAEELKESEKRMRNLAHMPVKGRLAYALLLLSNKFGTDEAGYIRLTLSRQDLASYVGATYETVFRTLGELADENIIRLSGKAIAILDKKTLVSISDIENNG